jgi:hypothetical protein
MSSVSPQISFITHLLQTADIVDDSCSVGCCSVESFLTPTSSPQHTTGVSKSPGKSPIKKGGKREGGKDRHKRCVHDKEARHCKECGGHGLCAHGRHKSKCVRCSVRRLDDGAMEVRGSFCRHMRRKAYCRECGEATFCEHDKRRETCLLCRGSQICEHGKQRSFCKPCGGSQMCEHGKVRRVCVACRRAERHRERIKIENLVNLDIINLGNSAVPLREVQGVMRRLQFH